MKNTGTFIQGLKGELIEVTDTDKALQQAKAAVYWHDDKMRNNDACYFGEAHRHWKHVLFQLEKLTIQNSHK